jgi:hypothetical protein
MKILSYFLISFLMISNNVNSQKVKVSTNPQNARISVNGVMTGSGQTTITVPKSDCVTLEVGLEGYVQEVRTYCNKKGMSSPPKSDYIQLSVDDSYTSSMQSDIANNEIVLNVKSARLRDDAWRTIVNAILGKFDVLEVNDEKSGYLRTAWSGVSFKSNTIRSRVIIKMVDSDKLMFKIKFISEESGKSSTAFSADEQYRSYSRILKKYDGFIEELQTRLAN